VSDGWEQIWQTSTIHWPGQESRNIILSPSWHLSLYLTVKSKQCDNKHAGWTITIFRIKNHYPILYIRFKNVSVSSVCVVLFALLCVSLCVCFAVCVTLCLLCCVCHFVFALLCVSLCVCFVVCVTLCLLCCVCHFVFGLLCVSLCVCFVVCVTLCLLCCVCHFVFAFSISDQCSDHLSTSASSI